MKTARELAAFEARLGHSFSDPALLIRALTHSSISTEQRPSNERLEFLGDRVLGLVMAQALMQGDRKAAEGQLAPRFNALVRKETCAEIAREIGLGEVLRLGKSERMTGGRRKLALLGDGLEAVIAALYLDAGLEVAREVILRLWGDRLDRVADDARDAKTVLQEWAQAQGMAPPTYKVEGRTGPDHAPVFVIRATLPDGRSSTGEATSKRAAEQAAARILLDEVTR
ncbi:ribonuclease III [Jannaschia aquimarina]|uniref:Ribonuclease 3 n=1 Tax=Jannaschia aquimarina TaxID=935700 RepID=A0A0D1D9E0_9RHOB|nr:ribonuclease III [Jannaschia aquimarina]KIT16513.1 Ribonuclease 3 [Jannaschia aquimarina]SNT06762.1 RNAse III [Jannaschia aquimarina]